MTMKENFEPSEESNEFIGQSLEISPAIGEDEAVCVIKPDAFPWRDAIVRHLEEMGLSIVKRKTKQLEADFVDEKMVSPEWSDDVKEATRRHFLEGPSEFLVVKGAAGSDALEKLRAAVGEETNPALCDRDTIRFIYGDIAPEKLPSGGRYYRNAVHRPKDGEEAEEDKKRFGEIF